MKADLSLTLVSVSHLSFGEPAVKEKDAKVAAKIESLGSVDRWLASYLKEVKSPRTGKKYARTTLVAAYNAVCSFYKANYGLIVEDAPSAWPAKNKQFHNPPLLFYFSGNIKSDITMIQALF